MIPIVLISTYVSDYIAKRSNEMMLHKNSDLPKRIEKVHDEINDAEKALQNYEKFIRAGNFSELIANNLTKEEARLKNLKIEQAHLDDKVSGQVYVTPSHVKERMMRLPEILAQKTIEANQTI